MATVKRRKPKALPKEAAIKVRVTEEQKATLTEAATRAGLGVSSWILTPALREAKREAGT
jgi:uncharacterized protein (DUF1778 family)